MTPALSLRPSWLWAFCLSVLLLAGCAQSPQKSDAAAAPAIKTAAAASPEAAPTASTAPTTPAVTKKPEANLPKEYLSNEILYEFMLGEIAAQRGDSALSAQAYIDLARRTRDPRIAERALEISYIAHMPDTAIEAAHIWLAADPDSDDAVRRLAGLLISTNKIDEARPYLQRILSGEAATRAEAFMQLNQLFAANPDRAENLRVVQELAQPYPALPEAHFAIAQAALAAGQQDLALTEIRNAMKLRPHWDIGVLGEAQLLQKSAGATAARERLESYLQTYPEAREVRLNYARVLVADRQYAEARDQFEQLLKQNPANTDVLFAVAVLSVQLEDYDRAEAYFKQLLNLNYKDPDNVRLYLGQIAEERERYPEALNWYRGITGEEHRLAAQIRQAQVLTKQGNLDAAREFLHQQPTQTNQQRVELILAEAYLLRDAKQVKEALDVVEDGLDKLPNDPELLYQRALLAEKLGRTDLLESSLRKLIRLKPEYAHAYNALGYSFADRNEHLPEAYTLIQKALSLSPDDFYIMDSMGWVLYRQGKYEEALGYLQRAYSGQPDPEIAAHLGEVLWASGKHDEARKLLQDALAKAPNNQTLQQTVQRLKL